MKKRWFWLVLLMSAFCAATVYAAYEHAGEADSDNFLAAYPNLAGSKLDHCALCHTGGEYEKRPGKMVSLGSCQWCHYSYGYDGSGNIVDTLNDYGKDYYMAGRNAEAITAINENDSDGDGYANAAEIAAIRFPGNAEDDPSLVTAPSKVYTKAQLQAMPAHTQFMLMNTSRGGTSGLDSYNEYTGVVLEDLLKDAGILPEATGITVFAPDGWSQYHPLEYDEEPEMYHINGEYPAATYYYDETAEQWCDYSAPSNQGRSHGDAIYVENGLRAILAYKADGVDLDTGVLDDTNSLQGEGPYRVVVPQKNPGPPDLASTAEDQNVLWPYTEDWDHNAGACTRSTTIIRVEPLPEGTTDIDVMEAGWSYVDQGNVIIYGAIAGQSASTPPAADIKANQEDGPVTVAAGTALSISVTLSTGTMAGTSADWFLVETGPNGAIRHLSLSPLALADGLGCSFQAPVVAIDNLTVLNLTDLAPGNYVYYFGVDLTPNNSLDAGTLYHDSVSVTISES